MSGALINSDTICLLVDPARIYRWQLWLAEDLRAAGRQVSFRAADSGTAGAHAGRLLLQLEAMIYRLKGERASDVIHRDEIAASFPFDDASGHCSLLVNFTAAEPKAKAVRVLTVLFDGAAGDAGVFEALADGRNVAIRVCDSGKPGRAWAALPIVKEEPEIRVVSRALDNVFSRAVELLIGAIMDRECTSALTDMASEDCAVTGPASALAAFSGLEQAPRAVAAKIARRLARLVRHGERWAIGWRRIEAGALVFSGRDETRRYNLVADDGRRYLADPFVFDHAGRTFLFCEEYPFATLKGVISVMEIMPDGTVTSPRVVLERPYHLSYPNVFMRDGEIWMMPETGDNRAVELYRAVSFPDKWEFARTLIDAMPAFDATLADHGGRLWMFASTAYRQAASWDNLQLFSADSLFGDWRPHPKNTVLIDRRQARPGGQVFSQNGSLLRPAQDGSRVYGGAMTLCRIDRLDEEDYAQTMLARIEAVSPREAFGVHTLNRSASVEVVDVLGHLAPDAPEAEIAFRAVRKGAVF